MLPLCQLRLIDHMVSQVSFHDRHHQAVHRATDGRNLLQDNPLPPRVVVGNYQHLGLFDGNDLAILEQQEVYQTLAELKQEGKTLGSLIADLKEPVESREIRLNITADDFRDAGKVVIQRVLDYANAAENWSSSRMPVGESVGT